MKIMYETVEKKNRSVINHFGDKTLNFILSCVARFIMDYQSISEPQEDWGGARPILLAAQVATSEPGWLFVLRKRTIVLYGKASPNIPFKVKKSRPVTKFFYPSTLPLLPSQTQFLLQCKLLPHSPKWQPRRPVSTFTIICLLRHVLFIILRRNASFLVRRVTFAVRC